MAFYVLDENNNKVEAYDKEGVLAVLEQAIENGSLEQITANSAFVTKLKCCVGGGTYKMAFITQEKYNDLKTNSQLSSDTFYWITDDTTCEEINNALTSINNNITSINNRLDALGFKSGVFVVSGVSAELISTNTLKKQGKYVIASLELFNTTALSNLAISVPSDFKPKENTKVRVGYLNSLGVQNYTDCTLNTNGILNNIPTGIVALTIKNAGWEVS